ncbi:Ig domain-containing protein [Methylobacterium sp. 17Sr1-1]|uniref:Ig domain-containing protein n=1 Tax=Methylobacterium sp. 17Sr1-1 TaxID=2202826 RepID=UPI0013A5BDA7|nr:Ig domain-containing protein [Methylobacterium sp. 17Sr1-1]
MATPAFNWALAFAALLLVFTIIIITKFRSSHFVSSALTKSNLRSGSSGGSSGDGIGSSSIWIGTWVLGFGIFGFVIILSWSYGQGGGEGFTAKFWSIFGTDSMVAIASAGIGGLLGFIFGIPRTLDPSTRVAVAAAASSASPGAGSQAALAANTNLERISDWFTTLLIGATLVQAQNVIEWIGTLGTKYKAGDAALSNEAMVPLIVLYFSALSFLGIYLITRLYLTFALQQTLALLTGVIDTAAPIILTQSLPDATSGSMYAAFQLQATGGTSPLRWSFIPRLPDGIELDGSTGLISGTPSNPVAKSTYQIVVVDSAIPPKSAATNVDLIVK